MSDKLQTDPPKPGPKLSTSASPHQGEAAIPPPSTPASTGCLLPYSDELLSARSFPWDHTRIWSTSLYKGRKRRPPDS